MKRISTALRTRTPIAGAARLRLWIGLALTTMVASVLTGAASPAGVSALRLTAANGFVTSSGGQLSLDGNLWRFTGYDGYQLTSASPGYQCGGAYSAAQLDGIFAQMAQNSGATVVRTWFFQSYGGPTNWAQYDRVLAAAAAHGIRIVPALVNEWRQCEPDPGGSGYRNLQWYQGGYTQTADGYALSFRDYAVAIAQHYANNPTIAFWQLVNEAEAANTRMATCDEAAASSALRSFAADVSGAMKAVDPNHLIDLGTIGTGQCGNRGADYASLYSVPTIDVCEVHDYTTKTTPAQADIAACRAMNKPTFEGEVGIDASVQADGSTSGTVTPASLTQRSVFFQQKMTALFGMGGSGFLIWNKELSPSKGFDVGPGDPVEPVMLAQSAALGGSPPPPPPPPPPATTQLVVSAPSAATTGSPITVNLIAEDASGTPTPGYTGTVHFTSSDAAASLPSDYTFTGTDSGVHSFSSILNTNGGQTVSATDTATSSITGTTGAIAVSTAAAPAMRFTVRVPTTSTANSPFSVKVTAQSTSGGTDSSYRGTVHFSSTDATANLPGSHTFTSGDAGVHTFTVTLHTTGAQTVTVTDTGSSTSDTSGAITVAASPGSSGNVTVTPAPPFHPHDVGAPSTVVLPDGSQQLVFSKNSANHLTESWYAGGNWNGPVDLTATYFRGGAPLASAPAASVTPDGSTQLVFWQGPGGHLFEAWFAAASWHGPVDVLGGFAALSSAPTVTVTPDGSTQAVFWRGAGGQLIEAWYTGGTWHGPVNWTAAAFGGAAPLASAPSATVTRDGSTQIVFWQGAGGHLIEAWYGAASWHGPVDWTASAFAGAGPLTSAPTVTTTPDRSTQMVFWQGPGGHMLESWYALGSWHGPVDWTAALGGSPLTSAPTATVTPDGSTQIVFWQGPGASLQEAWYTGRWNGPVNFSS